MRLPDFILANRERILVEWDLFARSVWPEAVASPVDLRDHAEAMLCATALDMRADQTSVQQSEKSKGGSKHPMGGLDRASREHAANRVAQGMDLRAVMAEYRALRASVVRLWCESIPEPQEHDLYDLTRFHESIDQSLAEAVQCYTQQIDRSRELFLRILGHDIRTPLNAIVLCSQELVEALQDAPPHAEVAAQIGQSGHVIGRLLNDFLGFATTRLGRAMPITRSAMDFGRLCQSVVAEVRAGAPQLVIQLQVAGEVQGTGDADRLRQLVTNLLDNALHHGAEGGPVEITVSRNGAQISLAVHNGGRPIPQEMQAHIFEPLVQGRQDTKRAGSIGLGLFIAREVALAHGGRITVQSSAESGTTFTVTLPAEATPCDATPSLERANDDRVLRS